MANAIVVDRSIPACAGEPPTAARRLTARGVYPRVCGGTVEYRYDPDSGQGLSPRVRGNRRHGRGPPLPVRSILACAGEPVRDGVVYKVSTVYPRVCGGTSRTASSLAAMRGLSPRVRGNRAGPAHGPAAERSIPACAGEPDSHPRFPPVGKVYPRVCGGTRVGSQLSPTRARVYPRVCGGTPCPTSGSSGMRGLSPRVRGNLHLLAVPALGHGSIPACAGEPPVCGGVDGC